MKNALTPSTLEEALKAAATYPTYRLIAGGSDWMVEKERHPQADGIIALSRIDELRRIGMSEEGIVIGATATVARIGAHPLIADLYPLITSACDAFGSKQIRNVATIGGNVAHASPAADLVPVLVVLGAKAIVESSGNRREVDVERLILSKGKPDLKSGEIITGFILPGEPWQHSYYRKIGRRSALNIAVASLCALGRRNALGGWDVRLSGASLSPLPRRFVSVENLFAHGIPDPETIRDALARDIEPHSGLRGSAQYRLRVTANMIEEFSHELA